jgi:hypothetical protein
LYSKLQKTLVLSTDKLQHNCWASYLLKGSTSYQNKFVIFTTHNFPQTTYHILKDSIVYLSFLLILIILLFSFIKTRLRPFVIAGSGLLLGGFLLLLSLKERGPATSNMASMGDGLGEALLMGALFIVYIIYLVVLLIVWWRFHKKQNAAAALQIKRGLLWSIILLIISVTLSSLDVPKKIKYALQEKKANAAFKYEFNLLTTAINKNDSDYNLYAKRAAMGESFVFLSQSYSFGNKTAIVADANKAYSLNPNDYDAVSMLANIFYAGSFNVVKPAADIIVETTAGSSGDDMSVPYAFFLQKAHLLFLDSLNKEITKAPTVGNWYYERAQLYKEMKDTASAMLDFEKLNSLKPKHTYNSYIELANYYLRKKDINKSNTYYRKHIGDYTFNEGPFEYLSERGRLKENIDVIASINDYKEALTYKLKDYTIKNKLEFLYLSIGDSVNAKLYSKY